jgi:hypothetical protein
MVKKAGETEVLRCSFCNKDQNDVRKLIAGPTVFICDECVEVCKDIIADDPNICCAQTQASGSAGKYHRRAAWHQMRIVDQFFKLSPYWCCIAGQDQVDI